MTTKQDPNETATTPPATVPPQVSQTKRTTWPIVLGLIALLSGGMSIPMIFHDMAEALGPTGTTRGVASGDMRAMNLAIRMGLAIWLVWGSLDLVRRRAGAKKSLRSWAAVKLFLFGITMAQIVAGLLGALSQAGRAQDLMSNGFAAAAFVVWTSAVLPVFVLAWFGRAKIKEEVARWA